MCRQCFQHLRITIPDNLAHMHFGVDEELVIDVNHESKCPEGLVQPRLASLSRGTALAKLSRMYMKWLVIRTRKRTIVKQHDRKHSEFTQHGGWQRPMNLLWIDMLLQWENRSSIVYLNMRRLQVSWTFQMNVTTHRKVKTLVLVTVDGQGLPIQKAQRLTIKRTNIYTKHIK